MINLLIHSKFRKYIKVTTPSKLPPTIKDVINKIDKNLPVNGMVFHPAPELGLGTSIFFGVLVLVLSYLFTYLFSSFDFSKYWYYVLAYLLLVSYFFFRVFLKDVWWVKKFNKKYFIYIGDEGIIKKNMTLAAFIPFSHIKGAKVHYAVGLNRYENTRVYLELIIKEDSLLNPALVINRDILCPNIVQYDYNDLKKMADLINDRLNYVDKEEVKRIKKEDEKWYQEKFDKENKEFNNFSSNDDFMNVSSIMNEYGFDKNNINSSIRLEEKFNLNGKIHKIVINKKGDNISINYNGKDFNSINEIENEFIRQKIEKMLNNR